MPGGYSVRIYRKKYKKEAARMADRLPAAFVDKADRKRWISLVTRLRMQDLKEKGHDQK